MKILHLIEATATGTLSITFMAANGQAKNNNLSVIFSRRPDTPKNIESLFEPTINLIEENLKASRFPFSVFALRKHLKQIKPDVVHCHSSFAGFVGRLAAIGLNTKVFYSPHCISFMRQDISPLKKGVFKAFELIACIKKSTYIACSQSEYSAIKAALPFAEVVLLENAVDLSDFKTPINNVTQSAALKVITVGGIRPQKGPAEFAKLAITFKNENIEFIWIGDGEQEHKQCLLDAGVKVKGWMPRADVINELAQADLYLSTALWEGMPVSIIEACAAGVPVIARNCDGNKDIISHGSNGYLFNTTAQAIEQISSHLVSPAKLNTLAQLANQQVFTRFSVERFSSELARIYRS
ncbi:glycosyltransferase [Pseudoalteromonas sp. C12FD-1]|uniref:glycosyltransferase n=1 Tax=Pseudoalteromonas sp. C12FD-1 TaxID=3131979 RepID=UPI00307D63FD